MTALLACLFILTLMGTGSALERITLAVITITTTALFLIAQNRRIMMTDQGIRVTKYLRIKDIFWKDINHVGSVILRKRVYLLLTTAKGLIILSNAYEDFSVLTRTLIEQVGPEKAEAEVLAQGHSPFENKADVISLWFAVVAVLGMVVLKVSSI
jgi:hypothetical protein